MRGQGNGRNQGSSNPGGGRNRGNKAGSGPVGNCVCPNCGKEITHERGVPCYELECPECGSKMIKE